MRKVRDLLMMAALVAVMHAPAGIAQDKGVAKAPPDAMKLTSDDYFAIQQMVVRYAWVLDRCTNGGYDYADLYVPDGQFSVAEDWGTTSNEQRSSVARGRDALAKAAGGGENGKCVDPKDYVGYGVNHIVVNHLITPTRIGAIGQHKLIAVGVCGYPHLMELQGGYEDVYTKTKDGWKFQSRIHVFHHAPSLQFGVCPK
jgi:hypothetical protein